MTSALYRVRRIDIPPHPHHFRTFLLLMLRDKVSATERWQSGRMQHTANVLSL